MFVLAAAGVLDGRTVTTHWRYAERLSKRYPTVTVEPNSLYIDSGQVLTSAGSAAGLDMLLHLVRRDYGAKIANQVAQRLVIPPHREGGQAQYLPRPMPQDERNRLSKLIDWVRAHPSQAHTLRTLARRASMSPRTLQRQFQETVGFGPYEMADSRTSRAGQGPVTNGASFAAARGRSGRLQIARNIPAPLPPCRRHQPGHLSPPVREQLTGRFMSRPNKLLLVLSFVGFIALGLPDAVIGVVWPALRAHFGLHQDALGPLFITVTVGSVMASTASGVILSRMGIGELLAFSCALTAVALFGYTIAPSWTVLVSPWLADGLRCGRHRRGNQHSRRDSLLRATGQCPARLLWRWRGGGTGVDDSRADDGTPLAARLSNHRRRRDRACGRIHSVSPAVATAGRSHMKNIFGRRDWSETLQLGKVQLSLLVFLIYTGCEAAAGAWVFSLLYEARGITTASAGTAVTLYWGGLFASRLGYAFLPSNVNPESIVKLCMIVALAGVVTLLLDLHPPRGHRRPSH